MKEEKEEEEEVWKRAETTVGRVVLNDVRMFAVNAKKSKKAGL